MKQIVFQRDLWSGLFGGGSSNSESDSGSDYKSSGDEGKDINDISEVASESDSSWSEAGAAGNEAQSDPDYDSDDSWNEPAPDWVPDNLKDVSGND